MILLWATSGRDWGFRFLISEDEIDPLPLYEETFSGAGDGPEIYLRQNGKIALRFPDPEHRKDAAGRTIFHDFVLAGDLVTQVDSVASGELLIWPQVAGTYSRLWNESGER